MGGEDTVRQRLETLHKTDELLAKSLVTSIKPVHKKNRKSDGRKDDAGHKQGKVVYLTLLDYRVYLRPVPTEEQICLEVSFSLTSQVSQEEVWGQVRGLQELPEGEQGQEDQAQGQ